MSIRRLALIVVVVVFLFVAAFLYISRSRGDDITTFTTQDTVETEEPGGFVMPWDREEEQAQEIPAQPIPQPLPQAQPSVSTGTSPVGKYCVHITHPRVEGVPVGNRVTGSRWNTTCCPNGFYSVINGVAQSSRATGMATVVDYVIPSTPDTSICR